jgi:2-keto-4-pentenoate hydratase/2-oxohepta-3-ene-1,7-dioic acid hydratase in catechol pathway
MVAVQDRPGSDPDQGPLPPGLCKFSVSALRQGFLRIADIRNSAKGVRFARKPPLWMKPGDVVEVEIDGGIGVLRNPIIAES